ncbi:MAG: hypothetical protein J0M08_04210 [Bacteroidetes bacterium]|nr:hypothetical protein [Bacteroidota bacterium]
MKRISLLLIMASLITSANAQKNELGVYAGIHYKQSFLIDRTTDRYVENFYPKSSGGGTFGVAYKVTTKRNFIFGTHVLYSKNTILNAPCINSTLWSVATKSISFPITAGYTLGRRLFVSSEIGVGPSFLMEKSVMYNTADDDITYDVLYVGNKIGFASMIDLSTGYILNNRTKFYLSVRGNSNVGRISSLNFGGGIMYSFLSSKESN